MMKIFIGSITAIHRYILNIGINKKVYIITDNPSYFKLKNRSNFSIFIIYSLDIDISLTDIKEINFIIIEVNHLLLYLKYRFGVSFMRRIAHRFFENFKSFSKANNIEIWVFLYKSDNDKVIFMPNWILAEKIYLDENNG